MRPTQIPVLVSLVVLFAGVPCCAPGDSPGRAEYARDAEGRDHEVREHEERGHDQPGTRDESRRGAIEHRDGLGAGEHAGTGQADRSRDVDDREGAGGREHEERSRVEHGEPELGVDEHEHRDGPRRDAPAWSEHRDPGREVEQHEHERRGGHDSGNRHEVPEHDGPEAHETVEGSVGGGGPGPGRSAWELLRQLSDELDALSSSMARLRQQMRDDPEVRDRRR